VFCRRLSLQLLALMGVRKLMDFFFTQTELYWLDHMLPGEDWIKKEDEQVSSISIRLIYYKFTGFSFVLGRR